MNLDYPWPSSYEAGVPPNIDPDEYPSITSILEEGWKRFHSLPSFHCMGKTYTYGEMDELSKKFAVYLTKEINLKKGDRLALMMPNILQYPVALFGALRAGIVVVNVNPLYTARELEYQLCDSGARAIVIFENACHILQKVVDKTPVEHILTTGIGDFLFPPKSLIVNFVIKRVKKMIPPWHLPGAWDFKKAVFSQEEHHFTPLDQEGKDVAFLQYTGGTTGRARAAILTHRNIVANVVQARAWIKNLLDPGREIVITPLPLYHIFSLTANCFIFSSIGSLNVLVTNPKDLNGFVKELGRWKYTAITGVNTLFNALLNHPNFKNLDFTHLKISLGGGMSVQKATAVKWKKTTGIPLIEAYGLTETSPAVCINPMTLEDYNGKIGLPIPSTTVAIRDDEGKDVPLGQRGEICVKGPQVMAGYWQHPEETAEALGEDGFLKTGDIGIMDEKGFVEIVDRKKDMILVSGFNVFPREIEDVLSSHPGVFEACAVGVAHEKSGETVKAFVVKKEEALTEETLLAHCRANLTAYKVPRSIEFRREFPKSPVGKILRRKLREG